MTLQSTTLNRKELRQFGLLTGTIVAILFGALLPWLFDHVIPLWPWIVAGVLWLWALIIPKTLQPVYSIWMKIGHALGWINSRIILGVLYYILIFPAGVLMQIFRKDPMLRKHDKQQKSYRVETESKSPKHMERPF